VANKANKSFLENSLGDLMLEHKPRLDHELRKELGRKLFAQKCDFLLSVAQVEQMPQSDLPEVAFAGRSNVGKSSLLNSLTGHKSLAYTSKKPGRTKQINFFCLGNQLMLADLPGYGYAYTKKTIVKNWTKLIDIYLKGRPQLRRVCLLIDSRHGLKTIDRKAMEFMNEAAVVFQIILTKCDKVKTLELEKTLKRVHEGIKQFGVAHPEIVTTSSVKATGIKELRETLSILTIDENK